MNPAAQKIADAWDPAKDEAAGEQCKAYGAPGLMRGPTRLRITWLDDDTLKLETRLRDADAAVRLPRRPRRRAPRPGRASRWRSGSSRAAAGAAAAPRFGAHEDRSPRSCGPATCARTASRTATGTVFTEYWDLHTETNGDNYLVVTNIGERPDLPAGALDYGAALQARTGRRRKWDPAPCDARF